MNPLSRIGVESSELKFFTWAGLCLMLVGAGSASLQNAAETLFLKRIGVEALPLVFLAGSLLLALATMIAGQLLDPVDRPRWLPRVLLGLGACLVPVWAAVFLEVPGVLAALLVLVKLLDGIALLVYWIALGDLITGRQAKRLFAPLAAGATLGRLIGSFGTEPVSRLVGIEGLVLVSGALYVLAALAAFPLRKTGNRADPKGTSERLAVAGTSTRAAQRRPMPRPPGLKKIWQESRLFRFLVVWSFCVGALGPMLYFQFSYSVDLATSGPDGEQRMLALYAQFRGWLNFAVLILQLVVSAKLYRRFGLPMSAAVWPVTYLGGFVWMWVALKLPAAMATIAATRLEGDAVAKPALKILHNLLPGRFRSRAIGLTEGPVKGIGGAVGNAMVIVAIGLGGPTIVSLPALPLATVWVLTAIGLWRLYPKLLLEASSSRSLSSSEEDLERLLDPATIRALAVSLSDPDPDVGRAAAELIAEANPASASRVLCDALAEASPEMRPVLVEILQRLLESSPPGEIRDERASAAVARLLEDREVLPPEERADLVQIYARLSCEETAGETDPVLDDALGDPEAAVRLAAIAELSRRGVPPPGVRDLDSALAGAFSSREILLRRTARNELRANLLSGEPDPPWEKRLSLLVSGLERRVDRAEVAASLVEIIRQHPEAIELSCGPMLRWLKDPDPRVRASVLELIGEAGLLDRSDDLIAGLASQDEQEARAAQDGLVALGPPVSDRLGRVFRSDDLVLRDRVIGTLCRLGSDPVILAELYERELEAARRRAVFLAALGGEREEVDSLLSRALTERIYEGLGGTLCLIAALDSADRVADLEGQMRSADDAHRRSILVEALESLLAPQERAHLVPLFEAETGQEIGRVAASQLGIEIPTADEALAQLAGDSDPLLRRLALELQAPRLEESDAIADTPAVTMQPTQIAAHLQRVPGFNRLMTRQLVGIADAFEETSYETGELLFDQGDDEASLFVLVEGEVTISVQGREVRRLGPGDLLGEPSTLDGGPSMEQARAESDVIALELEREPLIELMSQAPAFSIGLSQLLVGRIRRLQEEIARATPTGAEQDGPAPTAEASAEERGAG